MADEAQAQAPQTPPAPVTPVAAPAAPEPSGPTVPDGQVLIDSTRLEQLERSQDNYNGVAPHLKAAASLGYKTPEQFGEALTALKTFDERGVDPTHMFRPIEPEPALTGAFDADAFEQRILGTVNKANAQGSHKQMDQAESRMIESLVTELAGTDASEVRKEMTKAWVADRVFSAQSPYANDHPLAGGVYQPHDSRSFETVAGEIRKSWQESNGQTLVDAANGAFQPLPNVQPNAAPGSVAGAQAMTGPNGQVAPTPELPMYLRSRDEKLAAARTEIGIANAAANQHPMSQAS